MATMAPVKFISTKERLEIEARGANKSRPGADLPNTNLKNYLYVAICIVKFFLFPLWPIFVAIEARDPWYCTHYFQTLWQSIRTLRNTLKTGSIRRMIKYNIVFSPEMVRHQLSVRQGACTRCGKCCKMLQCPYLGFNKEKSTYYCSVYNTKYWIFGSCGRFPLDQQDVDDYNCPGFSFPPPASAPLAIKPLPLAN